MKDYTITYRQLVQCMFFLIFLSSSFDIVLNLRIGGFSFRFVYIIIILLFFIYFGEGIRHQSLSIRVIGLTPFILWSFLLIVFIPNTPLIGRNIGYILWLYIHFAFIIVCGYYFKQNTMHKYVQLYLITFLLVGLLGLIQLLFGLFGVNLFVEQWWIEGRLPRLNGFSYEPSYFATYLIIGFSLAYYLHRRGFSAYGKLPLYTSVVTLSAIFLSSSRMGLLVAFLQIVSFELAIKRKNIKQILLFVVVTIVIVGAFITVLITNENLSFLLSGLGVMGGSAHSSLERLDGFITQLTIFSYNPLKGYSLGGVSQAIALEKGITSLSQETIKPYDVSINIFVEVLTASGLFGFIFFLWYIYCLLLESVKTAATKGKADTNSLLLNGLVWSLIFEFVILCFNQNILRAYLWVHIAVLNGVFFQVKKANFVHVKDKKAIQRLVN